MILDSAEIAGLSVLQLVHENTAAATMFGIDRMDRNSSLTVLFYNMGAMDTEVSIVRYSAITEMPQNKSVEHIEVLSEAWDKNLGGADLDKIILNMLAERFNALKERQGKPDVRENPKAIKRLVKEVSKLKDILSANKQVVIKLGELADYDSLNTIIERREFEEAASGFFARVAVPVEEALKKAGLTLEDIEQVEILGGGIRVPKVQEILQEKLGGKTLNVHLNGDEAMCFGSAFIASNSSASFKVRKVLLTQHPVSPISIHITPANVSRIAETNQETVTQDADNQENSTEGTSNGIQYDRTYQLYKIGDYLGQRKTLSLTYDTNLKIDVYSGEDSDGEHLATFTVNGIDEIADSELLKKENVTRPRVSLSFELSRTGILLLNKAEAKVEETYYVDAP
jgi:hypoxia up-regulated 1